MSAPANIVYSQGTGAPPVTADNLNTFVQTAATLAAARGFTGTIGMQICLQGYASPNDGGQGNFSWSLTTGADDGGITTIVPTGSTAGCWIRQFPSSPYRTPQTVSSASGATLTAANVTGGVLIRSGAVAVTDSFPSAPSVIAAITAQSGNQVGSFVDLLVINENSSTLNISPGSGAAFLGNLSGGNFAMANGTQRLLKIYIASASTITVYG